MRGVIERGRRPWLCAAIAGLASGYYALAGQVLTQYSSRLWQMEDGLPHNIVQAVIQTRDGFLWVGTREGLARFDGVQFHPVKLAPDVGHPSISCLLESREGDLWVGTEKAGLFRLHAGIPAPCPAPDQQMNFSVYELHQGGDGAVWIASSAGVLQWKEGKLLRLEEFRNLVRSLCVDPSGAVWMAGGGVLRRLGSQTPTNYVPREGSLPEEVRRAYCDRHGVFWITSTYGVVRFKDGVATHYPKASGPSGFVCVMLLDRTGELWLGTYAGLSRLVDSRYSDEPGSEDSSYHIFSLFADREGDLWVGSEEGLARLTPKQFRTYTKKEGLRLNSVVTTCASRDGSIWVGTWGGGMNHLVNDQFTVLGKAEGLSSDFVMALHEGHDGSLWIGTDYGSALNQLKEGRIIQYGRPQGYRGDVVSALFEDESTNLWIGTRDGLQCLHDGKFQYYTTADHLTHNQINILCGRRAGGIWIGTEAGVTGWCQGAFTNFAAADARLGVVVLSLYEDTERALWIGTRDKGLLLWKDGRVVSYTTKEGLYSDTIYSILEDNRNNLWLTSSKGIFRVSKKQLAKVAGALEPEVNCITYGKADGIISSSQSRDAVQPVSCKGADGRLWFRTTQGVSVVDPAKITQNDLEPPVVIEEVIADRRTVATARLQLEGSQRLDQIPGGAAPAEDPQVIRIPPGRGELEISYAALSFKEPEKNRFKYRLEGAGSEWVEAGARRVAYYNHLRPGRYLFRVTACNNDGVWNEPGTSVALVLRPHFWQTWWFSLLVVSAGLGLVAGTVRYTTWRRMQRQLERLEHQHAVEKERARIAEDIHDELGAKLTRISFQGATAKRCLDKPAEARQHIEKMSQTARDLVSSLDEIVWAVDPDNDFLDNLATYICRYASEYFEDSPVRCQFNVPPTLPRWRLSSDVRHNVFLAIKEALNNALKHSGASQVDLTIGVLPQAFEIVVEDNGHGLEPEPGDGSAKLKRTGRGLINIRERMQSIKGSFELTSKPGQGARLRLQVPMLERPE
jgi:ligand-binding sensor domain-containing protein/signal transduction histidine kinase